MNDKRDGIMFLLTVAIIAFFIIPLGLSIYALPDKLKADINASKAQVRGAAALERIADILEGKK